MNNEVENAEWSSNPSFMIVFTRRLSKCKGWPTILKYGTWIMLYLEEGFIGPSSKIISSRRWIMWNGSLTLPLG